MQVEQSISCTTAVHVSTAEQWLMVRFLVSSAIRHLLHILPSSLRSLASVKLSGMCEDCRKLASAVNDHRILHVTFFQFLETTI